MKGNKQQLLKAAVEYYRFLNTIIEEGDAQAAYKLEDVFRIQMKMAGDGMLVIEQTDESGKFVSMRVGDRQIRDISDIDDFETVEI